MPHARAQARPPSVLVVEDDPRLGALFKETIEESGCHVEHTTTLGKATNILHRMELHAVLADMRLPDGSGIDLLERARFVDQDLPVVLITAHASVDVAVEAMRRGAFHFVVKPAPLIQLQTIVMRAVEHRRLKRENILLQQSTDREPPGLVGEAESIHGIRRLVRQVGSARTTVLITGESGTGKEIVAHLVHEESPRRAGPFVKVNCAAIPNELLEAELFGARRGAYTGAERHRLGRFQQADGGTLFLDEISTLNYDVQAKLLRALQDAEIQPLGADEPLKLDVRTVAATNQRLEDLVEAGTFREDLFYRINVFPIHLPPLRERMEDLPLLVDALTERICRRMSIPLKSIGPGANERLSSYRWPGNVRELENTIERAIILSSGNVVDESSLRWFEGDREERRRRRSLNLHEATERLERRLVNEALAKAMGVKKDAARLLGLSPRALSYYVRKHGLSKGRNRGRAQ